MGSLLTPLPLHAAPRFCSPLGEPGTAPGKFYRCEVVFGSPGADCRATGICKILALQAVSPDAPAERCRRTRAMFTAGPGGQSVTLLLLRGHLCPEVWRRHLRHGVLDMPEPCALPADLTAALGLAADAVLPAGRYVVEERLGFYELSFPLHYKSMGFNCF